MLKSQFVNLTRAMLANTDEIALHLHNDALATDLDVAFALGLALGAGGMGLELERNFDAIRLTFAQMLIESDRTGI